MEACLLPGRNGRRSRVSTAGRAISPAARCWSSATARSWAQASRLLRRVVMTQNKLIRILAITLIFILAFAIGYLLAIYSAEIAPWLVDEWIRFVGEMP